MKFFPLLLIFLFLPGTALAGSVIGVDTTFALDPIPFLATGTPEADIFNYFFTLEVFVGMVALFIRICLRVLKL